MASVSKALRNRMRAPSRCSCRYRMRDCASRSCNLQNTVSRSIMLRNVAFHLWAVGLRLIRPATGMLERRDPFSRARAFSTLVAASSLTETDLQIPKMVLVRIYLDVFTDEFATG